MNLEQLFLTQGSALFPGLIWQKLTVGTAELVAMINPKSQFEGQSYAYFGFWKMSVNAIENSRLFSELKDWAEQHECKIILGPIDISTFFSYRLRINPNTRVAFFGEPQNGQKEIDCLQINEFIVQQFYETLTFHEINPIKVELEKLNVVAKKSLDAAGLHCAHIDPQVFRQHSPELYHVTEEIFSENSFYLSIPANLFLSSFIDPLLKLMDYESSFLLLDSVKKIVGYSLALKDPADNTHLLIKSVGVEKPFRLMGLSFLSLIHEGFKNINTQYSKVSFCLMRENNFPSLISKKISGDVTKYALFGKKLN